ncbi:MAG TPA: hypothetical protein VGO47_03705, partial [Chlamydiales bacterium]|nr:hypothetical protein [Chlamydiales bacterium]
MSHSHQPLQQIDLQVQLAKAKKLKSTLKAPTSALHVNTISANKENSASQSTGDSSSIARNTRKTIPQTEKGKTLGIHISKSLCNSLTYSISMSA